MVGLEAGGKAAGKSDGGAEAGDDADLRATAIRSCRRISLETAAAISGVRPGARFERDSPLAWERS